MRVMSEHRAPPNVEPLLLPGPQNTAAVNARAAALARLLPLWPQDLRDVSLQGRRLIVRRLAKALRAERQRGRGGHWAYSLARHAALAKALQDEYAALAKLDAAVAP